MVLVLRPVDRYASGVGVRSIAWFPPAVLPSSRLEETLPGHRRQARPQEQDRGRLGHVLGGPAILGVLTHLQRDVLRQERADLVAMAETIVALSGDEPDHNQKLSFATLRTALSPEQMR